MTRLEELLAQLDEDIPRLTYAEARELAKLVRTLNGAVHGLVRHGNIHLSRGFGMPMVDPDRLEEVRNILDGK